MKGSAILSTDAGQDTSMAMVALLVSSGVSMMQGQGASVETMGMGLCLVIVGVLLAYIRGASKPHRRQQLPDSEPPKRLPPGGAS